MKRLLLIALAAAIPLGASGAEIVLSQGLDGYDGAFDASIFEDNLSGAAGAHVALFAGNTLPGSPRRALIRFNLIELPPGTEILDARLELDITMGRGGDQTMTAHRLLAPWGEGSTNGGGSGGQGADAVPGDVTWLSSFHPSIGWPVLGGDFNLTQSGSGTAGDAPATTTFTGTDLTEDVRFFLANPNDNFGWIILGNESESGTAKRFHSREATDQAVRPRLVITVPDPVPVETVGWVLF